MTKKEDDNDKIGKVGRDTTWAKKLHKEFRKLPPVIKYSCGCSAIRGYNYYFMHFCGKHSPYKKEG